MKFICKVCGKQVEIDGTDLCIALAYAGSPDDLIEFTCEECECKQTGAVA